MSSFRLKRNIISIHKNSHCSACRKYSKASFCQKIRSTTSWSSAIVGNSLPVPSCPRNRTNLHNYSIKSSGLIFEMQTNRSTKPTFSRPTKTQQTTNYSLQNLKKYIFSEKKTSHPPALPTKVHCTAATIIVEAALKRKTVPGSTSLSQTCGGQWKCCECWKSWERKISQDFKGSGWICKLRRTFHSQSPLRRLNRSGCL